MKLRRVIIAPIVQQQIRQQALYIAEDSIDHALAWEERLRDTIIDLANFAGYAIDEDASKRLGFTLHKRTFETNYIIHFVVDESKDEVRVVNFRHGARLPRSGEP